MQPDIYAVQKDGVTIGWYATEEAAKNTAKATDGDSFPRSLSGSRHAGHFGRIDVARSAIGTG